MFLNVPIEIPVCYWSKTTSSTIEYKMDNGVRGTISGYCFRDIQTYLGKEYIYSYIPAEAWI